MKKNTIIIATISLLILLGISAFIAIKYHPNILTSETVKNSPKPTANIESGIILFYGDGCPHCALVEKYLTDNKVAEKVVFTQKEVYKDTKNSNLLADKAHSCGLNTDSIGVPFLWDGATGQCFVGDVEVTNFFKQKIGQ